MWMSVTEQWNRAGGALLQSMYSSVTEHAHQRNKMAIALEKTERPTLGENRARNTI